MCVLGASVASAQVSPDTQLSRLPIANAMHDDAGWLRMARFQPNTRVGSVNETTARQVVARLASQIHPEPIELRYQRTLRAHGFTVVRFVREVWGLPLMGSSIIVRFRGDALDFVSFELGPSAGNDPGPAVVDAPIPAAVRATRWVRARPLAHELIAFAAPDLRKVWRVEVEGALHERADVLLDASDGQLLAVVPRVLHQMGRVYDPNPTLAVDPTDEELGNLTSARFLTGRYARAQSCRPTGVSECVPEQRAQADTDGNFLYDPEEPAFDDEFAEVNIYFHSNRVAEYFRDTHAFEWACCESSNIMDAIANYVETPGVAFRNAFYSPSSCGGSVRCALMAFGQSSTKDFGYDGDVVYHEYGHGIVDVTAGLSIFDVNPLLGVGYENGALNEGTADYFSATITADPKLADYFAGSGPGSGEGGLRELNNGLRCPDDLFGESHADGRIWGGALWGIREMIGAEKADALAFATLVSLGDGPDLDQAGNALSMTAASLDVLDASDRAAVDDVIADRGLIGCERIVPVEPGRAYTGYSGDAQLTGFLGGGVVPLHYAVDIPSDAVAVRIRLESTTAAGEYDIYVNNGAPARYRGAGTPRLLADDAFPGAGLVRLTRTTDHAIPVCDTLYFAIIATDLTTRGPSVYELSVEIDTEAGLDCPEPETDAGPPVDSAIPDVGPMPDAGTDAEADAGEMEAGGGGCGCRLTPGSNDAGLAFSLGVLMLVAWRRRK